MLFDAQPGASVPVDTDGYDEECLMVQGDSSWTMCCFRKATTSSLRWHGDRITEIVPLS